MAKAKASKAAAEPASQVAAVPWAKQSLGERASYIFAQYLGLVFALAGPLVLYLFYGQGYMSDTAVSLTCFALILIGLFFHETRPFNVST